MKIQMHRNNTGKSGHKSADGTTKMNISKYL